MLLRTPTRRGRRGATMVECGVVLLVTLLLVLGGIVGSLGVYRYQAVAALAREGARYASVHGGQYQIDTGNTAATPTSVYTNAISPKVVALDTNRLTYSVTWDNPSKMPAYYDSVNNVWKGNTVTVTVTYQWIPEAFFGGATMTSTSVMPVTY
jgi:Flp pilus assembly protein TadG